MEVTVRADRKPLPPPPSPETVRAPRPVAPPPPAPPVAKAPPAPPVTVAAPSPGPEMAPRRSGLPTGLILGGAALVFLLAAGVAGIAVWRHLQAGPSPPSSPTVTPSAGPTPSAPTPSPSVAVPPGALHVETQPAGASVTINGEARASPHDIADFPEDLRGQAGLKGCETKTQGVELGAAAAGEVKLTMTRPSPTWGSRRLSSPFERRSAWTATPWARRRSWAQARRAATAELKEGYEPTARR
jgi:hypothetical protein